MQVANPKRIEGKALSMLDRRSRCHAACWMLSILLKMEPGGDRSTIARL